MTPTIRRGTIDGSSFDEHERNLVMVNMPGVPWQPTEALAQNVVLALEGLPPADDQGRTQLQNDQLVLADWLMRECHRSDSYSDRYQLALELGDNRRRTFPLTYETREQYVTRQTRIVASIRAQVPSHRSERNFNDEYQRWITTVDWRWIPNNKEGRLEKMARSKEASRAKIRSTARFGMNSVPPAPRPIRQPDANDILRPNGQYMPARFETSKLNKHDSWERRYREVLSIERNANSEFPLPYEVRAQFRDRQRLLDAARLRDNPQHTRTRDLETEYSEWLETEELSLMPLDWEGFHARARRNKAIKQGTSTLF